MKTFKITEKQDFNSVREGYEVQAENLTAAKRIASKKQAYFGTVITIEHGGEVVASKSGKSWTNHQ